MDHEKLNRGEAGSPQPPGVQLQTPQDERQQQQQQQRQSQHEDDQENQQEPWAQDRGDKAPRQDHEQCKGEKEKPQAKVKIMIIQEEREGQHSDVEVVVKEQKERGRSSHRQKVTYGSTDVRLKRTAMTGPSKVMCPEDSGPIGRKPGTKVLSEHARRSQHASLTRWLGRNRSAESQENGVEKDPDRLNSSVTNSQGSGGPNEHGSQGSSKSRSMKEIISWRGVLIPDDRTILVVFNIDMYDQYSAAQP